MMRLTNFALRVALILGLSPSAFSSALADGRAVLPPKWMVEAYLSDALVKPSRDDIARAIIPGLGMVTAFMGGENVGPLPTYVATGSPASGGGSAGLPIGWAAGDYHLALIASFLSDNSTPSTIATPTGFTLIGRADYNDDQPNAGQVAAFYRFAQSGDAAVSIAAQDTSKIGFIVGYRGVSAVSPTEAFAATNNVSVNTGTGEVAYNNITTLGPNRVAVEVFGNYNVFDGHTGTPGSGWTERGDATSGSAGLAVDVKDIASAGAVGSGNHTLGAGSLSFSHAGRLAFAIRPT